MNKIKLYFCLFLFLLSLVYISENVNVDLMSFFLNKNKGSVVFESIVNKSIGETISFLNFDSKKSFYEEKEEMVSVSVNKEPLVYIYNTHQKEEYMKGSDENIPTVVTASNILHDELNKHGVSSLVETRDIINETKRRGYDYTGTYTVSFDYLKETKSKNNSIKYFFDIHRDSITGSASRANINNKRYATIMFLVGASYEGYEKRLSNINVMKEYLSNKYPGLMRDTYIQKKCSFYQKYSPNMFLIEIGGPDNSIEEVRNSVIALAEAISIYIGGSNEKD